MSGREYYSQLSEKQRKAAVKEFYDYFTRTDGSPDITHESLRHLFRQFVLRGRPEENFMRFGNYTFLLSRKLGILKARTSSGVRTYRVMPWPPELPADQQLETYITTLQQLQTTEPISSLSDGKEAMKAAIRILVQTPQHREVLMQNKFNVTITTTAGFAEDAKLSFPHVVLEDVLVQTPSKKCIEVHIENSSTNDSKTLVSFGFVEDSSAFMLEDEHNYSEHPSSLEIPPTGFYTITVVFAPRNVSIYKNTLAFEFIDGATGKKFQIIRFVKGHATIHGTEVLQAIAPYQRKRLPPRRNLPIVDGVKPPSPQNRIRMTRPLPYYDIPQEIQRQMDGGEPTGTLKELLLTKDKENHKDRFEALLWIEERQMHRDIRKYDRQKDMTVSGGYLSLEVVGLAENRPSLLKGDRIFVTWTGATSKYCGYVHRVEKENVLLKFHQSFHDKYYIAKKQYDIQFTFNRTPLRIQHRALVLEKGLPPELLYPPSNLQSRDRRPVGKLVLYDSKVERNPEQKRAVEAIVFGQASPVPYIIYGPPGTGKTKTTVESIKQVLKMIPGSRVLACAPSNSATDLLCEGVLQHWPQKEVLRLNAYTRPLTSDISEAVLKVSCYDKDTDSFEIPSQELLDNYRVIVCTLTTAGRLVSIRIPAGHFSHVFVDESGHAVEPECLIPVAGLLHPENCNLVLAGDPKQLGPILRSRAAIQYGLQTSFLERLMTTCDIYKQQPAKGSDRLQYNSEVVTKLVENYRSHPDILKLPNREFYDDELKAKADEMVRTSLCRWQHLPKEGFPIIFHGIEGKDEREADSPSFFNKEEVVTVYHYVKQLLESRDVRVAAKEIGVISPYRKQVEKIRKYLKEKVMKEKVMQYQDIKVGSVEEFQGQERRIIIISTVRSNATYLAMDRDYNLGFLDNPKRFNVAITRAKALLVVVGNPKLLSKDKYWRKLIEFVQSNGGYTGIDFKGPDSAVFSDDEDGSDDSDGSDDEGLPESKVTGIEDPEWKNDQ